MGSGGRGAGGRGNGNINFNGNDNFNKSKSGEKVNSGAESCPFLAIVIAIDIAIEKIVYHFLGVG